MRIEGSNDVIIRLPQLHACQFPDEKTLREAVTASFVAENTQVPVPEVVSYGLSNHSEVGAFIIMQYVEYSKDLSDVLAIPNENNPDESHMLNPDIPNDVLESFYNKAAVQLLRLFDASFPRIGSLAQIDGNTLSVAGRPVTQNMNNMAQLANISHAIFPPKAQPTGLLRSGMLCWQKCIWHSSSFSITTSPRRRTTAGINTWHERFFANCPNMAACQLSGS
jgi:hypothetical protein